MARLTADQWSSIRAEREAAGTSFRELAAKYKVSDAAIVKRSKSEGWSDGSDVDGVINRKVSEKVSGVVSADDPKKKAAAIDAEADRKAAVVNRHRQEWTQVAALRQEAVNVRNSDPDVAFSKAKLAKITAEMTKIQQDGERKAWGLDIIIDPKQLEQMSDEQLEAIASGKSI